METRFKDFLKEQMKDPDFKREYEALELEDTLIQAFIDARKFSGISKPDIGKLEVMPA